MVQAAGPGLFLPSHPRRGVQVLGASGPQPIAVAGGTFLQPTGLVRVGHGGVGVGVGGPQWSSDQRGSDGSWLDISIGKKVCRRCRRKSLGAILMEILVAMVCLHL